MSETIPHLSPLLTDSRSIRREAVIRRKAHQERAIQSEQWAQYEIDGWKKVKTLKRSIKAIKEKPHDERLENRFWMLMFRLGYPELNKGRKFQIRVDRKGAETLLKQVDIFAKDDETVIVAECKSSEKNTKRSLQKDIEEFANLKGPISSAIKQHYGADQKLKIIWLFVTENIVWSKPDKERAVGQNIRVVTEKELRYFSQIAEYIGKSARYQFLAEFLKDQEIPGLTNKRVPAIRGKLGGKSFYCFSTTPRHLLKIAFVNHRSLSDPEGAPAYQRLVSKARLRAIGTFINEGGFFPNNLLINFTRDLKFEKTGNSETSDVIFGMLYLPSRYRSAWVIDGQHRLYGFSAADDKFLDQNIIVVAFEKLPKIEEAGLFVTINHEQKSVPKHLLDDLEGDLKWESKIPSERIGAIASRLIAHLNSDLDEPFYNRVTQQGIKTTHKTCLTIPALKEAIIRSGLIGRAVLKDSHYEAGPLTGKSDAETLDRARDVFNQYFKIIKNANPAQWEKGREGDVGTNPGVQGYILLLGELIKYWETLSGADPKETETSELISDIEEYLEPVTSALSKSSDEELKKRFTVILGSSGPVEYCFKLCQVIKSQRGDFRPAGLDSFEAEQSDEKFQETSSRLRLIEEKINQTIFDIFRAKYGSQDYWEEGIADNNIKSEAYKRSLEDEKGKRGPLESYLNLVDYKKIIEHRQNWNFLKDLFNIAEAGEKGLAKNLKWLDRINELRRIPSHPSPNRKFKSDDHDYVDWLYSEFNSRTSSLLSGGALGYIQARNTEPLATQSA